MYITNEQADSICTITLNRPEVLNSFNREMAGQLLTALEMVRVSETIRAVLLTGAGRAFCAGQDLSEVSPKPGVTPALGKIVRECYNPVIRAIREIEKPFVCAVNGTAAGAGANLALACDIVCASEGASFIQSFSKVGLIPDSGGTFMLPRLVGLGCASWMTFLGDKISATEALGYGMLYRVFPAADLLAESHSLAARLASMPTRGIGLTKRLLNSSYQNALSEQLAMEEEMQQEAGLTEDYREGVSAFLEKRTPVYKGR